MQRNQFVDVLDALDVYLVYHFVFFANLNWNLPQRRIVIGKQKVTFLHRGYGIECCFVAFLTEDVKVFVHASIFCLLSHHCFLLHLVYHVDVEPLVFVGEFLRLVSLGLYFIENI